MDIGGFLRLDRNDRMFLSGLDRNSEGPDNLISKH